MERLREAEVRIREWLHRWQPQLERIEPVLRSLYPYCALAQTKRDEMTKVLQPYYPEEAAEIALGIVLLLLGGRFAMTIACWQAFQVSGSRLMAKSWVELKQSYQRAKTALASDSEAKSIFARAGPRELGSRELLDLLREIATARTEQELRVARRRISLLMECVDPAWLLELGMGLWTGAVAVLATVRSKVVAGVGVGAGVGQHVADAVMPYAQPRLHAAFPRHVPWVDAGLRTTAAGLGALASLVLMRPINAFNSAFQGSAKLTEALLSLSEKKGWLGDKRPTEERLRRGVWALALLGFFSQLRMGFKLPPLVRWPLAPVLLVEHLLHLAATAPVPAAPLLRGGSAESR